jgi:hypothetical protein
MKNFSQFHDGYLDGLFLHGSAASIFLSTASKQAFVLQVSGVRSLKVDNFRQGNIIFDVLVRDGAELTVDDVKQFFEFKDEAKSLEKLEHLRHGGLVVLEINPSYGAACSILAESVELGARALGLGLGLAV